MAGYYTESNYENAVLQLLNEGLGYTYVYGPDVERDYHSPLFAPAILGSIAGAKLTGRIKSALRGCPVARLAAHQ